MFDPWVGEIRGGGNGNHSCIFLPGERQKENSVTEGAWQAAGPAVAKSQTRLSRLRTHALADWPPSFP